MEKNYLILKEQIEGAAKKIASGSKVLGHEGKSLFKYLETLDDFFKVRRGTGKALLSRDIASLKTNLNTAIRNDIKDGVISGGKTIGPRAKDAYKKLAMKEILMSEEALSEKQMIEIIERNKNSAKNKIKVAELKYKPVAEPGAKPKVEEPPGSGKPKPGEPKPEPKPGRRPPKESFLKGTVQYAVKRALLFGGLALAAYVLYRMVFGGDGDLTPEEKVKADQMLNSLIAFSQKYPCIGAIMDDDSSDIKFTEGGSPVVYLRKTGVPEYDADGGLGFMNNGTMFRVNSMTRGTYNCKQATNEDYFNDLINRVLIKEETNKQYFNNIIGSVLLEQGTTEMTDEEMSEAVKLITRYLHRDWFEKVAPVFQNDNADLVKANNLLKGLQGKTYKGQPAIGQLHIAYETYTNGRNLQSDINTKMSKKNTPVGTEARESMKLIAAGLGDGNPNTGLANINIYWRTPGQVDNSNVQKINYNGKPLPHPFGAFSPEIAKVQGCLSGLTITGWLENKTLKALKDKGYDMSQGLTQEIYNDIMTKCGKTP